LNPRATAVIGDAESMKFEWPVSGGNLPFQRIEFGSGGEPNPARDTPQWRIGAAHGME
jgi:hypothetical protein